MKAKIPGKKGQTAFEFIVIATLALIVVLGMLRLVPETTFAIGTIAFVKSEALKILSEEEKFYYIADIEGPITYHPGVPYDTIKVLIGNATQADITALQVKFNGANLPQKLVDAKFYSTPAEVTIFLERAQ